MLDLNFECLVFVCLTYLVFKHTALVLGQLFLPVESVPCPPAACKHVVLLADALDHVLLLHTGEDMAASHKGASLWSLHYFMSRK